MTELVINEHERTDVVEAGQIRMNEVGSLVLITKNTNFKYNVVFLKSNAATDFMCWTRAESSGEIKRLFPHVIENARITVDLNEK